MKLKPTQKSLGTLGEYSTNKYDFSFVLIFDESDQKYYVHEHGCPNKTYSKFYDEVYELKESFRYHEKAAELIKEHQNK
jgi:hypothetical protein